MAERSDVKHASANDLLVFRDSHQPRLEAADYTLEITQDLTVKSGATAPTAKQTLHLRVAGPQVQLPADAIVATFPANKASGRFDIVLPHVTLSNPTLPWLRLTERGTQGAERRPWLTLVVLSAAERSACTVGPVKVKDLSVEIPHADAPDPETTSVTVLDMPAALADKVLPEADDLPWLAHVRAVNQDPETATLLAARLPEAGTENHVFLVSLEDRLRTGGAGPKKRTGVEAVRGRVKLAVLHQWSFIAEPAHTHGFIELLTEPAGQATATALPFTLGKAPPESRESQSRLDAGMVPVEHRLRNGDRSAAWYHGPFLPGAPPVDAAILDERLPADHADQLMLIDRDFAMFDVSYAAAWELGRLLVLENSDVARSLFHWKRTFQKHDRRRKAAAAQVTAMASGAPVLAMTAIAAFEPDEKVPPLVATFLQKGLMELREVPFRNLVPEETMLPPRSVRFFDVDPHWLAALRDGALSVGRTDSGTRVLERQMRDALPIPRPMSGILVRSSVVSDFPHLEVDGYSGRPPDPGTLDGSGLPVLRFERLSPSVLLVLFAGHVDAVDIHLHPQALHFGFVLGKGSKKGREIFDKNGHTIGYTDGTEPVGMTKDRRVDMSALAEALGVVKGRKDGRIAELAKAMLDGVPLVRFTRDRSEAGTT